MSTIIPRLAERLTFLVPNMQWAVTGNDYDTLLWFETGTPPTINELTAIADASLDDALKELNSKELNDTKALKAIVFATADRLAIDRATFAQEVKTVYKSL